MPHEIITVISDIKHYEIIMIFMISLRISRAVPSSRLQSHCAELQITISAFHRLRSTSARRARASRTTNMRAPRNTTQHDTRRTAPSPHRAERAHIMVHTHPSPTPARSNEPARTLFSAALRSREHFHGPKPPLAQSLEHTRCHAVLRSS